MLNAIHKVVALPITGLVLRKQSGQSTALIGLAQW